MTTDENAITRFFSVQGIPEPALPAPKTSTEQAHESARRFFSQTLHPPSQHERDSMDTRYETFRTVEDLGDTERAFYEAVGKGQLILGFLPSEPPNKLTALRRRSRHSSGDAPRGRLRAGTGNCLVAKWQDGNGF